MDRLEVTEDESLQAATTAKVWRHFCPESGNKLAFSFKLIALFFIFTALYHVILIIDPALGAADPSPVWRHALFVGINLSLATGLILRPPWFIFLFSLLTGQQMISHGNQLIMVWDNTLSVDWPSVLVLLGCPAILLLLHLTDKAMTRTKFGLILVLGSVGALLGYCTL